MLRSPIRRLSVDCGRGVEFWLPGLLPAGLNERHGAGRRVAPHVYRRAGENIRSILAAAGPPQALEAPVRVEYVRFSCQRMDWDNLGASFKHVGDALVRLGYLADDGPDVIAEFRPGQVRVRRRPHQGTFLRLTPIPAGQPHELRLPPWVE